MTVALPNIRRMALALAVGLLATAARAQDVPTFFLGDGPDKDTAKEQKNIVMRPNVDNPFYPYVNNPTANERTVVAVLKAANGKEIAKSAPIVAPANGRAVVTFQGDKPIPLSGAQVRLQLLDDRQKELSHSDVELAFLEPSQYAQPTASFEGGREGTNELKVTVTAAKVAGPPIKLKLNLAQVPGLVLDSIKDGALEAEIPSEGGTAVLNARNLRFEGPAKNAWITVSVDGYDRAFIFETQFDGTQPLPPKGKDFIAIAAPAASKPTPKFPVRVEVDLPSRSYYYVALDFDKSGTGVWRTWVLPGDRQRSATVTPAGPDGTVVFGSVVKDWTVDVDAAGVLGARTFRARLLAPAENAADRRDPTRDVEKASTEKKVMFDDSPPEAVKLIIPREHVRGTALKIRATAADPESGIDRVLFFVGDTPKPEVRVAERGRIYVAEPPPTTGGEFVAVLPMADVKGPVAVGVRVINGVGMATDATGEIMLVDPAGGGGPGKPTTGDIKGVVVQGSEARPQAGRQVYLIDEKKTATLKTTESNAKGEFAFKDLPPGNYNVFSSKPVDGNARALKAVSVEAGKTTEVTLSLLRTPPKKK